MNCNPDNSMSSVVNVGWGVSKESSLNQRKVLLETFFGRHHFEFHSIKGPAKSLGWKSLFKKHSGRSLQVDDLERSSSNAYDLLVHNDAKRIITFLRSDGSAFYLCRSPLAVRPIRPTRPQVLLFLLNTSLQEENVHRIAQIARQCDWGLVLVLNYRYAMHSSRLSTQALNLSDSPIMRKPYYHHEETAHLNHAATMIATLQKMGTRLTVKTDFTALSEGKVSPETLEHYHCDLLAIDQVTEPLCLGRSFLKGLKRAKEDAFFFGVSRDSALIEPRRVPTALPAAAEQPAELIIRSA